MEIAVNTGLPAIRDMKIKSRQKYGCSIIEIPRKVTENAEVTEERGFLFQLHLFGSFTDRLGYRA